jgi:hypothetical protein
LDWYGSVLSTLHSEAWAEVKDMARTRAKIPRLDFSVLLEDLGMKGLVEQLGVEKVIDALDVKTTANRLGINRLVDAVGMENIVKERGVDELLAGLSPAQVKELKKRLK